MVYRERWNNDTQEAIYIYEIDGDFLTTVYIPYAFESFIITFFNIYLFIEFLTDYNYRKCSLCPKIQEIYTLIIFKYILILNNVLLSWF